MAARIRLILIWQTCSSVNFVNLRMPSWAFVNAQWRILSSSTPPPPNSCYCFDNIPKFITSWTQVHPNIFAKWCQGIRQLATAWPASRFARKPNAAIIWTNALPLPPRIISFRPRGWVHMLALFFPLHYVEGLLNSRPRVESVHTEIAMFGTPPVHRAYYCTPPYRNSN